MPDRVIASGDQYIEVALTLDTVQYASGDVLAATQEVAGAVQAGRPVTLNSLALLDKSDQGQALDLLFLRSNVSIGTENAAAAISTAAADEILTKVNVGTADYTDFGSSQFAVKGATAAGMGVTMLPDGGSSLYVAAISRGTGTYAADAITLKLGLKRP
jgi:hypothetical protein